MDSAQPWLMGYMGHVVQRANAGAYLAVVSWVVVLQNTVAMVVSSSIYKAFSIFFQYSVREMNPVFAKKFIYYVARLS